MDRHTMLALDQHSIQIGVGFVEHWELCFNKRSYKNPDNAFANIRPKWGSKVFGVMYWINDETLPLLDKKEGYPKHYQRTMLPFKFLHDSSMSVNKRTEFKPFPVMTYIATNEWTKEGLNVSEMYKQKIWLGLENINETLKDLTHIDLSEFNNYKSEVLK